MKKLALTVRTAIERAFTRFDLPNGKTAESAVRLLLMIAAHESGGFTYCKQKGGPALGLFQMEPATFEFVMGYLKRTGKFKAINRSTPFERLLIDPEFAAAMARVYLWTFPAALPSSDDLEGLASYAKKYWNTEQGKASSEKYLNDFISHVWSNENEVS
ncbi:MAG: hypothetical protein RPT25_15115 [Cycloclasticus sp.]